MPLKEKDDHLIDRYLSADLTKKEAEKMEERMEDPAFQEQVAWREKLSRGEIQSFKASAPKWFFLGALTLLVLTSFWFFTKTDEVTGTEIFNTYFVPYPNILDPWEDKKSKQPLSAFQLYEKGAYEEAQKMLLDLPDSESVFFYEGMIYLIQGEYDQMHHLFTPLRENRKSHFHHQANWYGALALLKKGKLKEVIQHLETIAQTPGSPYRIEAEEILNQL